MSRRRIERPLQAGGRESRCNAHPMLPGNAAGCFYFMADRLMQY